MDRASELPCLQVRPALGVPMPVTGCVTSLAFPVSIPSSRGRCSRSTEGQVGPRQAFYSHFLPQAIGPSDNLQCVTDSSGRERGQAMGRFVSTILRPVLLHRPMDLLEASLVRFRYAGQRKTS